MARMQIQYTVRSVPEAVDRALRARARSEGISLNQVLVHSLEVACGTEGAGLQKQDLDWIAGTWVEDEEFNQAQREQRRVHPDDWR